MIKSVLACTEHLIWEELCGFKRGMKYVYQVFDSKNLCKRTKHIKENCIYIKQVILQEPCIFKKLSLLYYRTFTPSSPCLMCLSLSLVPLSTSGPVSVLDEMLLLRH